MIRPWGLAVRRTPWLVAGGGAPPPTTASCSWRIRFCGTAARRYSDRLPTLAALGRLPLTELLLETYASTIDNPSALTDVCDLHLTLTLLDSNPSQCRMLLGFASEPAEPHALPRGAEPRAAAVHHAHATAAHTRPRARSAHHDGVALASLLSSLPALPALDVFCFLPCRGDGRRVSRMTLASGERCDGTRC